MIYLSKNNQVEVFTDNVVNFIPDVLDVYLNDVLLGSFDNLSDNEMYLRFIIPTLDKQEMEYKMKIYTHKALIKEELVIIKNFRKDEIKTINNSKEIVFYER